MRKMRLFNFAALLFAAAFIVTSCQKDVTGELNPTKQGFSYNTGDCAVAPVYSNSGRGGNADCDAGYEATSERQNIEDVGYSGTFGPIEWEITEGKYLSWSGNVCGVQVIVKGGNASNIYTYEDCNGAAGLHSPINNGGNVPEISNITFCWNLCPEELVCHDETGWGGSTAGAGRAWWYAFDTQGAPTQPIYAGQQLTDGTVTYDGTNLIIDLGSWTLQAVDEPVKVQGYNTLPTSRPAPGQFTTYKGTSLTVQGNNSRYYAIHLDMRHCE
jgi:hypothetical protein